MQQPVQRYALLLRILHWCMAVTVLALIAVGWYMAELLPKDAPERMDLYGLHKSFGVTVLLLVALRIMVRWMTAVPPLPETIALWERRAATSAHYALYACMALVPLTGYCMTNAFGFEVQLFGAPLPVVFPADKDLGSLAHDAHGIIAYTLLAVIGLHVASALKHIIIDKYNVIRRMW